jgi:dipeptidyl aminopeptidase/acylaminoacyl peptidase
MTRLRSALVALALLAATLLGTTAAASSASATYSGKDGKIAFVRANQIYTMSSTGTGVTKLTSSGKNYRPHWSPDGKRLSYINETAAGGKDVWVMSATGGHKQQVTRLGNVSSAGASWSPDGRRLAFADDTLETVKATAPFGAPVGLTGYATNSQWCGSSDPSERYPVYVDRFVAWSPDGSRIAVFNHSDCYYDDAISMYYLKTGELREYAAVGSDSGGYHDWSDLFWGPANQFGYADIDRGDYGEDTSPSSLVYAGYTSTAGDTGGAPSPSGAYLAVTNASSGTAKVYRVNRDGTGRRALATGYQADWQRVS